MAKSKVVQNFLAEMMCHRYALTIPSQSVKIKIIK